MNISTRNKNKKNLLYNISMKNLKTVFGGNEEDTGGQ
jgi:hypothetical protein